MTPGSRLRKRRAGSKRLVHKSAGGLDVVEGGGLPDEFADLEEHPADEARERRARAAQGGRMASRQVARDSDGHDARLRDRLEGQQQDDRLELGEGQRARHEAILLDPPIDAEVAADDDAAEAKLHDDRQSGVLLDLGL